MEKYKGLKEELTDVVDDIEIGDGIILYLKDKDFDEYIGKKVIGYLHKKKKRYLQLKFMKNPSTFFEKWDNDLTEADISYKKIDDIKIADND